jgi:hypothetical protein
MIVFKNGLSDKEKKQITSLLCELTDVYGDFYITRDNLRLFIKENLNVLFDCLKKGDKIAFDDSGVVVICGFSDKADRKYLKFLTRNPDDTEKFLKVIAWNLNCDLYVKIKKNNPLKDVLQKNYFRFAGDRGKEILLVKRARTYAERNTDKNPGTDRRLCEV